MLGRVVGGGGLLSGAGTQAPPAGRVLVLGLTHTGFEIMVPMVVATA